MAIDMDPACAMPNGQPFMFLGHLNTVRRSCGRVALVLTVRSAEAGERTETVQVWIDEAAQPSADAVQVAALQRARDACLVSRFSEAFYARLDDL